MSWMLVAGLFAPTYGVGDASKMVVKLICIQGSGILKILRAAWSV